MSASERVRRARLIRAAEGYLELDMPQQAIETLDRLGDLGTFRAHVEYLRGEALRALGEYHRALESLAVAADMAPSNFHIRLAQGWCYKRIGRLDLAIESLEEALDAAPGEGIVHYNLACYYSLAKIKPRALEHLSKAFELDSSFRDLVERESDFDALRSDPDFQALTSIIV